MLFFSWIILFNTGCSNSLKEPGSTEHQPDNEIVNKIVKKVNQAKDVNVVGKVYKWKGIKNNMLSTTFFINRDNLKADNKNFGISLKMKHPAYLKKRGFKKTGGRIVLDYRGIYERSLKYFFMHSSQLLKSLKYINNKDPLNNFLRFVQYIKYKIPPRFIKGKYTREFFTPLQCIYNGYGDCDTKSLLLAEFLGGLKKREKLGILIMRGYGIFHAVLVINRRPLPGMKSLFFPGKGYFIPLETTIKNWMPGFMDKRAVDCLESGYYRFEPLN